ncbi:heavy metal-binding domain-containing protein [uncultured Polaribacter sp.]|uniref:heavy metal-binding domain-containing protein n=1 Tax=uncultured Polaribacter sp. TaxID=174711 RepID=UPI00259B367B|nr:heavy metal-binding domain-containing protein [uncultured Polaribacter sp.]
MILTTTNNIENFKIVDYLGIVTGTAYDSSYSSNGKKMSFKDMFSMSKYREMYTLGLEAIKEKAFQNLKENALKLKANAVVGIQLDVEPLANSNTLLVSITGTAVRVE